MLTVLVAQREPAPGVAGVSLKLKFDSVRRGSKWMSVNTAATYSSNWPPCRRSPQRWYNKSVESATTYKLQHTSILFYSILKSRDYGDVSATAQHGRLTMSW